MENEKHVVLFSTGLSSTMSLEKTIETYGPENVIALFTDTLWEDDDNYRYLLDIKNRYADIKWEIRKDGRTPREVFLDTRWLGNSRVGNCSVQLKVKQTHKFLEELKSEGITPVLTFGIGLKEEHRAYNLQNKYPNYRCIFPLIDKPMDNAEMTKIIEGEWGIPVPRMYKLGFSHANCGGRCVRAGRKHWTHLFRVWPKRYREAEAVEHEFRKKINLGVSILTRTVNGVKQPFTLKEFRKELEWNLFDYLNIEDDEEEEVCAVCVF